MQLISAVNLLKLQISGFFCKCQEMSHFCSVNFSIEISCGGKGSAM